MSGTAAAGAEEGSSSPLAQARRRVAAAFADDGELAAAVDGFSPRDDNFCWTQCHEAEGARDFRHDMDTASGASNHWSVEFGTHLSHANGDRGSGVWHPLWTDTSRTRRMPPTRSTAT